MPFNIYEGKKEVRFGGGGKKFSPDPGTYEVEIQDTIDTKFNEKSGITSMIIDFKTILRKDSDDQTSNGLSVRVYFPDGIPVAALKLKAVIHATNRVKFFEETYEDVPPMDHEQWPKFLKDIKDQLTFKRLEVDIVHNKSKTGDKTFANIISFAPLHIPKKVSVESGDKDFAWPESE
jgi:hypothetical protein